MYDSIIIGSGPAGMAAALYLARFGLSTVMLEKLTYGGMLLQTAEIENYPGQAMIKGYELADAMDAQLKDYAIDRKTTDVTGISKTDAGFTVQTSDGPLQGKTIIVASGLEYKKLGIPGEAELIGHGISFCAVCDGNFYRNKVVAVLGGGNAALEEALYLANLAKDVHLIHRRDAFRGHKTYQDRVQAKENITLHLSQTIESFIGSPKLEGLVLKSTHDGSTSELAVDGLFEFVGFTPSAPFLPADLEVNEQGFIVTDTEMRTNIPGIFAAGDIRSKACRQVVTAAGDGATAANSVYAFLEH